MAKRRPYTHQQCGVCREASDFKLLDERDEYERSLMVCTRCGSKQAMVGQRKPTMKELLARDD